MEIASLLTFALDKGTETFERKTHLCLRCYSNLLDFVCERSEDWVSHEDN